MSEEVAGTRKPNLLLRQQREQRGWSQKRVAEELRHHFPEVAVSENDIKRWESGKRKPGPYYREKLCIIFGKTASELGLVEIHTDSACQLTSQHVVIPTPEQITSLTYLLGLEDKEDMSTLNHSKRYALARLFSTAATCQQAEQQQSPLLTTSTSRRQALAAIIGTAAAAMGLSQEIGFPQLHPQETLLLCASNIPLCWSLYFEGGLTETRQHITPYLSQLADVASRPGTYQKEVATLASQAYQLAALTEILFHNMGIALEHAKRSIDFAALTGDYNLLTAAHIRLAVVYSNLDRLHQRLTAYEEAANTVKTPLHSCKRVYTQGLPKRIAPWGIRKPRSSIWS